MKNAPISELIRVQIWSAESTVRPRSLSYLMDPFETRSTKMESVSPYLTELP